MDFEKYAQLAATHAAEVDRGTFPTATLKALADDGMLGLVSARDVGGKGCGLAEAAALVERLARECGSTAMVVCMHFCATAVIEAHGPLDVRKAIAAGKHLSTLAFSEVGSRSQFWVSLGTAQADGASVRLTGKKSFVTSAHHADSFVWSSKPVAGSFASSAVIGHESLPRRPRPSKPASTRTPGVARGTSHSVDNAEPAVGLVDHT